MSDSLLSSPHRTILIFAKDERIDGSISANLLIDGLGRPVIAAEAVQPNIEMDYDVTSPEASSPYPL